MVGRSSDTSVNNTVPFRLLVAEGLAHLQEWLLPVTALLQQQLDLEFNGLHVFSRRRPQTLEVLWLMTLRSELNTCIRALSCCRRMHGR